MKVESKKVSPARQVRGGRPRNGVQARRPREARGTHQGPQTAPMARPVARPSRAKTADQAKARAKARKAKAPKVIRRPLRERLRERLIARLAGLDLRPQALLARIPFVVLVIAALAIGLAITLWLSTDAAQRSYQLGNARALNDALAEQKEALERDVLEAESAPALADAARNLGMIPSRDTAHLVLDPVGNWVVVGQPKPAEGAPPPPLNTKLPDENLSVPPNGAPPVAAKPKPGAAAEVPTRAVPVVPAPPGAVPVPVPSAAAQPGLEPPVLVPTVIPSVPGVPPVLGEQDSHGAGGNAPPGVAGPAGLVLEPVTVGGAPQPGGVVQPGGVAR